VLCSVRVVGPSGQKLLLRWLLAHNLFYYSSTQAIYTTCVLFYSSIQAVSTYLLAFRLAGLFFRLSMYIYLCVRRLIQTTTPVCLLPRVWVWGFWFGFALRRVALLCGVFVRLHLALFPAGGPFLPSLSVNRNNNEKPPQTSAGPVQTTRTVRVGSDKHLGDVKLSKC
jgi:hypothetical protein